MAYLLCTVLFAFLAIHSRIAIFAAGTPVPLFTQVLENYPTTTIADDAQFLTDAKLSSRIKGPTDALRVSYALSKSGYEITINNEQYSWSRTVTTDCKRYIATIGTMEQYLTAQMGNPILSSFEGKQGIVIFKTCSNSQNEHVDLYDGTNNKCKKQCNFNDCTVVQLFEVSG